MHLILKLSNNVLGALMPSQAYIQILMLFFIILHLPLCVKEFFWAPALTSKLLFFLLLNFYQVIKTFVLFSLFKAQTFLVLLFCSYSDWHSSQSPPFNQPGYSNRIWHCSCISSLYSFSSTILKFSNILRCFCSLLCWIPSQIFFHPALSGLSTNLSRPLRSANTFSEFFLLQMPGFESIVSQAQWLLSVTHPVPASSDNCWLFPSMAVLPIPNYISNRYFELLCRN